MKKTSIALMIACLVLTHTMYAQSIQEVIRDLYAERYKSAKSIFEKLVAANPNNIDAIYWLDRLKLEWMILPAQRPFMRKHCLQAQTLR
jgi:hypothetical protein